MRHNLLGHLRETAMNMKPIVATGAALGILALAACAPEVQSTIYLSDVLKVASEGGVLTTAAVLRIPQESEDSCKEGMAALIEKFSALAPTTGKGQCVESSSGDSLAEIETSLVILRESDTVPEPNLFAIDVAEDGSGNSLTFRLLKPIGQIIDALKSDSSISTDFDPSKFIFRIENDADGTVEVFPNHVFVDGEPALDASYSTTLDRRRGIEIRFSDVASVFVERGNWYTFASIGIPQ
jgi:hypothetical protein